RPSARTSGAATGSTRPGPRHPSPPPPTRCASTPPAGRSTTWSARSSSRSVPAREPPGDLLVDGPEPGGGPVPGDLPGAGRRARPGATLGGVPRRPVAPVDPRHPVLGVRGPPPVPVPRQAGAVLDPDREGPVPPARGNPGRAGDHRPGGAARLRHGPRRGGPAADLPRGDPPP